MVGPQNPDCDLTHGEKYRGVNENFREAANRWSGFLCDSHEHYMAFRDASLKMRILPPGRVQAGAGALKNVTLYNCFVMCTIHDSFTDGPTEEEIAALDVGEHSPASIMQTAVNAAITMRQGGGVGYDISTLRPRGDLIRGVQSTTDGPLAFAPIYDAVCKATSSAGNRRGAQMLVMRIDHPDIEAFIRAKQVDDPNVPWDMRPLRGFNISIGVTDEFMECYASGKPFPLRFNGVVYREVDPHSLWDMVMRGTYDWAEPGVLFIDRINEMNNLYYCEKIAATNPCGEQPLPPYGACLLGAINATKYLVKHADGTFSFDWDLLEADIPNFVRAMDNVIDRSRYPLPQQRIEATRKRRMGLGIAGLANALEALGFPYGTPEFLDFQERLESFYTNKLYQASAMLAKEKGSFPLYDEHRYLESKFVKQALTDETVDMIRKYGIRNSHLTSKAPTGTTSFCADNISSGIEPVFSYQQQRRVISPEGPRVVTINDYGVEYLGVNGRTAQEISAKEHVAVLCMSQMYTDSAVSKTCNVPSDYPFEDFKDLYMMAFEGGAKGCTTYRPAGNYDEPLKKVDAEQINSSEKTEADEDGACGFDPVTGQRTGACAND